MGTKNKFRYHYDDWDLVPTSFKPGTMREQTNSDLKNALKEYQEILKCISINIECAKVLKKASAKYVSRYRNWDLDEFRLTFPYGEKLTKGLQIYKKITKQILNNISAINSEIDRRT